jgi:hypothetical protein
MARARVAREMAMVMSVAGNKEGEGGKAMAMATRVAGERMAMLTKIVMATKTREVGDEEGIGRVGKSSGDGEEDGDGERRRR